MATEPGLGSRDGADPKQGKAADVSEIAHRQRVADAALLVKGGAWSPPQAGEIVIFCQAVTQMESEPAIKA